MNSLKQNDCTLILLDAKCFLQDVFGLFGFFLNKKFYSLCSGILPQAEPAMVEVDLDAPESKEHNSATISDVKEKSTIKKL